jgi:hypothetical protein
MLWVKDFRNFGLTGGWFAEKWVKWPDGKRQLLAVEHVVIDRAPEMA